MPVVEALKVSVALPAAPLSVSVVNVPTPLVELAVIEFPVGVTELGETVAVIVIVPAGTGFSKASRTWTTGCVVSATPLVAFGAGWVVMPSFAAAPAYAVA
jgi:hypothetical protein